MTWVLIWIGSAFLNWWLFEESWLDKFGEVELGDRVFFIFLAALGPLSIPAAVMAYLSRGGRDKSARVVRTRS